ncbi:hypothetical protein [Kitasatospora sp. GAS204B]|uniref:hypothetical protein n=1 Tax=unclassified Kitasatospora TaxID=2633591 RepID=UPI002476B16E|nr:hypothetical protein [Kitasatospora sp. GAS204B]MDH6116791.1 hypothetical protein [Kitasatospora sp. GAS204B]
MSEFAKRGLAGVLSAVVAAVTGIATKQATDRPTLSWIVFLVSLVTVGAALQYYLTYTEGSSATVIAAGPGSVAIGGSSHAPIKARASQRREAIAPSVPTKGVMAAGAGAVAVGGDVAASIESESIESGTASARHGTI